MIKTTYVLTSLIIIAFMTTGLDAKKENGDSLYLVHVICRHGERTPRTTYPKDPHKNMNYYPVGYGQLTNKGKQRMYKVGLSLKERYHKFLGNFYLPWQVKVRASDKDRTQSTAQLIMAGMYPPKTAQVWNKNFTWQPIPIHATANKDDKIFLPQESCERFYDLQKRHMESQKSKGKYRKYEAIFKGLRKETGIEVELPIQVMRIHDTLKCQKEWGFKLPSWTHDYYPEAMQDVAITYWEDYASTDELKKLGAGHMLKRIIDDTKKKIDGDDNNKEMKFYLYSGHDSNIVPMLELLDIYDSHIIPYGAYIAIEIHKKGKGHIVKVYYQNNRWKEPRIMHLGNCSKPCDFHEFVNNYKKYFPSSDDC